MKGISTVSILLSALLAVPSAAAQENVKRGSWQNVLALEAGTKAHVWRTDRTEQKGVIQKVTADGIELATKSSVVSILRADVRSVEVPRKVRRRGRNVAIAAGIGAAIGGGAIGALGGGQRGYVEPFALLGALAGAAVGAPLGFLAPDRETIFERR